MQGRLEGPAKDHVGPGREPEAPGSWPRSLQGGAAPHFDCGMTVSPIVQTATFLSTTWVLLIIKLDTRKIESRDSDTCPPMFIAVSCIIVKR